MRALCIILFCPVMALSQAADFETDFESYDAALNGMLAPNLGLSSCPGLTQRPGGFVINDITEYGTTVREDDPDPIETKDEVVQEYAALSPALRGRCEVIFNNDSGSTQSGSFLGPLSTRTYIPFTLKKRRYVDSATPDEPAGQAAPASQALNFAHVFVGPDNLFDISGEYTEVTQADTIYARGSRGSSYSVQTRYSREIGENGSIGIKFYTDGFSVSDFDGTISPEPVLPPSGEFAAMNPSRTEALERVARRKEVFDSYCSDFGVPYNRGHGVGVSLSYSHLISDAVSLHIESGVSQNTREYAFNSCLFRIGETASRDKFFVSSIEGHVETQMVDVGAKLEARYSFGRGQIVPRFGLSARSQSIASYAERERGPEPNTTVTIAGDVPTTIDVAPSGAALEYAERDVTSVRSEIGATYLWPLDLGIMSGAVSFDAAYFHEFADTERQVTAKFVGDGRTTPAEFSFGTNPVDPDVVTLRAGVDLQTGNNSTVSIWVSRLFGDDLYEASTLGADLRIIF